MSRRQRLFARGWNLTTNAFSRRIVQIWVAVAGGRAGLRVAEDRRMLKASLSLAGTQTLVGGVNVNASNDAASAEQNIAIDINPTNPLDVVGISQKGTAYTTLGVYHSNNGGLTWTTTTIDNSFDSLGASAKRFDPVIAYDSTGKLFHRVRRRRRHDDDARGCKERRQRRDVYARGRGRFKKPTCRVCSAIFIWRRAPMGWAETPFMWHTSKPTSCRKRFL